MNPFGILDAIVGAFDIIGHACGRKGRTETRRERISLGILYSLLLLVGVGAVILIVWQLYLQP